MLAVALVCQHGNLRFTVEEAQAAKQLFEKNGNCNHKVRHIVYATGRVRAACVRYSECSQLVHNNTADILECVTSLIRHVCDSPAMCAKGVRSAGGHVCCPAACHGVCDHSRCLAYPEPEPTIGDVESCCVHTIWSRAFATNYNTSCRSPDNVGCPLYRGAECPELPRPPRHRISHYKAPDIKLRRPPKHVTGTASYLLEWEKWVMAISQMPPSSNSTTLKPPAPRCDDPSMCARGFRSAGGSVCCAPDCGECDSSQGTHGRRACFLRAGGKSHCCAVDVWKRQLALNTSCQSPDEVACRLYRGPECPSLPPLTQPPSKLDFFDWQSRLMELDGPVVGHSRFDPTALERLDGRFEQHSLRRVDQAQRNRSVEVTAWLQANPELPDLEGKVDLVILYVNQSDWRWRMRRAVWRSKDAFRNGQKNNHSKSLSPSTSSDTFDHGELRLLLRSVVQHAKWGDRRWARTCAVPPGCAHIRRCIQSNLQADLASLSSYVNG